MNTKIDKELLFRYFSGLATPLENSGIERWLEQKDNEELFYQFLEEWERANLQYVPDKNRVFSKLKERIDSGTESGVNMKASDWYLKWLGIHRKWWGIAAAIVLVMGGAFFGKDRILYKTYATHFGETMTLVLDDASQVVLNANSRLTVPRWVAYAGDREVWMTGEAFFNVSKKSDGQKFVVHTNNLSVEVLGTRFNVTDRRDATKVVLQEGKVKVMANDHKGESAMLENTGDYAEVQKQNPEVITRRVDESLYTTWQEKRLKFHETPLPEVIQTIEDYYGITIRNSDTTLYDRIYTGTLPNNNLDIILQALTNVYGSEFLKENQ